ncbi:MAG: mevalonate kinase [Bacillota bacterium]
MKGQAHGKIILIGEHSVVHGHPAMAMPFMAGQVVCGLESGAVDWLISRFHEGPLDDAGALFDPIRTLIHALQEALGIGPFIHKLKSDIPMGAGLGSSAAIAAAVIRAYHTAADIRLDDEQLFDWIQFSEKNAHDNPSGIDALTVMHDHAWYFTKTHREPIEKALGAKLVIADTLERTATREAVAHVASYQGSDRFKTAMKTLHERVKTSRTALKEKNLQTLADAMNDAMKALASLGLSTPTTNAFIETAKASGALAAKLTGGGMGGCIIALCENEATANDVRTALEKNFKTTTWVTSI